MRSALPNSRIMIHQPSGGYRGQATDIEIHAKETKNVKTTLQKIYSKHTGQTMSIIEKSMERDNFMSPIEAQEFGIIDKIVQNREILKQQ
jgi:ATP-dependent Clp protease protease subunit